MIPANGQVFRHTEEVKLENLIREIVHKSEDLNFISATVDGAETIEVLNQYVRRARHEPQYKFGAVVECANDVTNAYFNHSESEYELFTKLRILAGWSQGLFDWTQYDHVALYETTSTLPEHVDKYLNYLALDTLFKGHTGFRKAYSSAYRVHGSSAIDKLAYQMGVTPAVVRLAKSLLR